MGSEDRGGAGHPWPARLPSPPGLGRHVALAPRQELHRVWRDPCASVPTAPGRTAPLMLALLQTRLQSASKPSRPQPPPTLQDGTQASGEKKKNNNQILLESRYRLDPRLGKAAIMTVMATTSCRENRMHTLPAAPQVRSARRERPDNTQGQSSHRRQSARHLCQEPNKHEGPTSRQRLSR